MVYNPSLSAGGPTITPKTMQNAGGGNALPAYMQMRTMQNGQMQPSVTPKSTAMPGEVAKQPTAGIARQFGQPAQGLAQAQSGMQRVMQPPMNASAPPMTPKANMQPQQPPPQANVNTGQQGGLTQAAGNAIGNAPKPPPQAGPQNANDLQGLYNFFASDLQNQAKQATANSVADAASRGVYYGTPLTGSEADINTQYLRGLGQLQAGMYGNEQQNQLYRLGLASNLLSQSGMNAPGQGGIDPQVYQMLGTLFGSSPQGQRPGPTGTNPAPQPGVTPATNQQYNQPQGYGGQQQQIPTTPWQPHYNRPPGYTGPT